MSAKWSPRDYGDPTLAEFLAALPLALVMVVLVFVVLVVALSYGVGL